MYEKILATICTAVVTFGIIWFICGRHTDRRTGDGAQSNSGRIRNDIEDAGRDASKAAADNRAAREDNQRAQDLVQKAKSILGSAKHTDSNS